MLRRRHTALTAFIFLTTGPLLAAPETIRCEALLTDPPAGSQSAKYLWLEEDSARTTDFLRTRNRDVNDGLRASPNRRNVEAALQEIGNQPETLKTENLSATQKLVLIRKGLGKAKVRDAGKQDLASAELQLQIGDKIEVIYSDIMLRRDHTATFLDFTVSPDKKLLLLTLAIHGSLDDFTHVVYDLEARQVISSTLTSASNSPVWTGGSKFYASTVRPDSDDYHLTKFDARTSQSQDLGIGNVGPRTADGAIISSESGMRFIYGEKSFTLPKGTGGAIVGVLDDELYFQTLTEKFGDIRKVSMKGAKPENETIIVAMGTRHLTNAKFLDGHLLYHLDLGEEHEQVVAKPNGETLFTVPVPRYCTGNVTRLLTPTQLEMALTSDFVKLNKFIYDTSLAKFLDADLEKKMTTVRGLEFASVVVDTTSADGTQIPVRLSFQKGVKPAGALIEVYGGFNNAPYFDPKFSAANLEFMLNGGVVAHPAARGGSEFGPQWHEAATREHKVKTMEDVAATSELITALGFAPSSKIVLTGTSNGGMVVAATALRFPEKFGLVIPISGVQDTFHKEWLDRRFDYGWAFEYGDSRDPNDAVYLKDYGPVENAARRSRPRMLVIVGRSDSRVAPPHSLKLAASLEENVGASRTQLLSVKNSGHWLAKMEYSDLIGFRVQAVIWTTIYDHLGMDFKPYRW